MLVLAHPSRQVAGIDVTQPGLEADLGGAGVQIQQLSHLGQGGAQRLIQVHGAVQRLGEGIKDG